MNVYILLDRSGSMASMWSEAISSINAYVEALPKTTNVFLATFDHEYEVLRNTTAKKWKPLLASESSPRGNTRLFDSAVRVMQRALDDGAERSVIVVMTDGFENASQNFNQAQVKEYVKLLTNKTWEIVFLGANFDKVGDLAQQNFGLSAGKFQDVKRGNLQDYMTGTLATSTVAYATVGASMNIQDPVAGKN